MASGYSFRGYGNSAGSEGTIATMSSVEPDLVVSDRASLADRILDAAQRIVLQTGARRLSLTEVAKLAGVARPTLYRYFVSKDELIDALGKREYRRFNTAMSAALSGR